MNRYQPQAAFFYFFSRGFNLNFPQLFRCTFPFHFLEHSRFLINPYIIFYEIGQWIFKYTLFHQWASKFRHTDFGSLNFTIESTVLFSKNIPMLSNEVHVVVLKHVSSSSDFCCMALQRISIFVRTSEEQCRFQILIFLGNFTPNVQSSSDRVFQFC